MSLVFADRVRETTTTTGTGTVSLAGASTQYQSFVSGVGSGNTCDYCILSGNGTDWETGNGTVTSGSPSTLSRTTIYESSNSGSAISLSGTSTVFLSLCATRVPAPVWTRLSVSGSSSSVNVGGASLTCYQVTTWSNPGSGSLTSYIMSATRINTSSFSGLVLINGSSNGYLLKKQADGNFILAWFNSSSSTVIAATAPGTDSAGPEYTQPGGTCWLLLVAVGGASNNSFSGRQIGVGSLIYAANDTHWDFTSGSWTLYVTADANTTFRSLWQANTLLYPFAV